MLLSLALHRPFSTARTSATAHDIFPLILLSSLLVLSPFLLFLCANARSDTSIFEDEARKQDNLRLRADDARK
jgi:hypothetical protein